MHRCGRAANVARGDRAKWEKAAHEYDSTHCRPDQEAAVTDCHRGIMMRLMNSAVASECAELPVLAWHNGSRPLSRSARSNCFVAASMSSLLSAPTMSLWLRPAMPGLRRTVAPHAPMCRSAQCPRLAKPDMRPAGRWSGFDPSGHRSIGPPLSVLRPFHVDGISRMQRLFLWLKEQEVGIQTVSIIPREATEMNKSKAFIIAALALGVTSAVNAQQQPAAPPQLPQAPNMTFFVTGAGPGKGADLGGIEGADQYCQTLAQRHGAGGKTWRAYLSTQEAAGKPAVNARDRIGNGPWQNFKGQVIAASVDDLHSDNNKLGFDTSLSERGQIIPGVGFAPNRHDVLTGSTPEGRAFPPGEDRTCRNWTSSTQGTAMVGHIDRKGLRDDAASRSWNSSHPSRGPEGGCSQSDLKGTGGDGLFYCFAAQ